MSQFKIKLTDEIFSQIVGTIAERTGNVIGQKQVNMIESRLTKRAVTLGIASEAEYLAYFLKNREKEIDELISLLTVHHTYFFREFGQFEFLGSHVLPALVQKLKAEGRTKFRVWSSACSRGQEAYSLFMFIDQYLAVNAPSISFEILGSDIDKESVAIAANGVYAWDEVKEIPLAYLSKYWVRGQGEIAKFAKIRESARKACRFTTANLMETSSFSVHGKFDIIFCRNVFIYFQADDVNRISAALTAQLQPDGYFFVGLSESLATVPKGLKKRGPSIYGPELVTAPVKPADAVATQPAGPIRIVCVDDSPVILKLLQAVLTVAEGFQVVGTAKDGVEAAKLVATGLKFDAMTLDIHMPNMTGIEYLESHYKNNHPPVVMLTSASRDNMDLAQRAMDLGAKDYVEKPSLADLKERADEIRGKLRMIVSAARAKSVPSATAVKATAPSIDRQFKRSFEIKDLSTKLNVLFVEERNVASAISVLRDRSLEGILCQVVVLGDDKTADSIASKLSADSVLKAKLTRQKTAEPGKTIQLMSFVDFSRGSSLIRPGTAICYCVFTNLSRSQWESCPKGKQMKILLSEEIDRGVFLASMNMLFVTPATSFAYMASEFFGKTEFVAA
jgi:chemotaxis protein methyltransferase CheR